jgi:hypothetical protein
MKITDIIRGMLDFIDGVDGKEETVDYEEENPTCELERIVQLAGDNPQFANSPDEQITPSEVIFSMGNDLNKPKHPSDIRADSISMYPNMQYNPENK